MSLLTRFHRSKCGQHARASRSSHHSSWNMRTSAIGTEDTHGRSTPRDQLFSHGLDPKGTLGTGSAGLAVGGAYLAVAAGVDHLVAEFGVARQDAPVDRAGGRDDLAVAAQ